MLVAVAGNADEEDGAVAVGLPDGLFNTAFCFLTGGDSVSQSESRSDKTGELAGGGGSVAGNADEDGAPIGFVGLPDEFFNLTLCFLSGGAPPSVFLVKSSRAAVSRSCCPLSRACAVLHPKIALAFKPILYGYIKRYSLGQNGYGAQSHQFPNRCIMCVCASWGLY